MNVVADRLFGLLLGWTRGLFNSLWNLVTNHSSGISGFLERFWLPIILIILLAGTVADYLVWIIRWRPYYVWRGWFLRRDRKKRLEATQSYMNNLDQAPLDLDYGPFEDASFSPFFPQDGAESFLAENSNPYEYQYQQPYMPPEAWQDPAAVFSPAPGHDYAEPEPDHSLPSAAWTAGEPAIEPQTNWQEEDFPYTPYESVESHEAPMEAPAETPVSRRRRRTLTKRQRQPGLFQTLRETLLDPTDPGEPLHSLPSPISQEEAYHEPYYPANYRYRSGPEDEDSGQSNNRIDRL
ncbi:MAG: hypothetical protein PHP02_03830 [Eubacteriales bacterium]|nr:hypothetical protein [Eubacteriales bacterium]